jgi:hypothetical protein
MKYLPFLISLLLINTNLAAQTADEIIANYFRNTGGIENWRSLEGISIKSTVNDNGMEIPSSRITLKDGRLLIKFKIQDKEIVQVAFDGKEAWGDNFITMEAEKEASSITNNLILAAQDFPHPLLNYKKNGYTVELLGKELNQEKEYFKIKLKKKKHFVEDQEVDNIKYYYFDTETYKIKIVESEIQSGKLKGKFSRDVYDDYKKVGIIYYPHSVSRGIDGLKTTDIKIESVELNPKVDDSIFQYPGKK